MASTNTKAAAEVQEKKFDWHQIKSYLPIISFVAIVAIFGETQGVIDFVSKLDGTFLGTLYDINPVRFVTEGAADEAAMLLFLM